MIDVLDEAWVVWGLGLVVRSVRGEVRIAGDYGDDG